MVNNHGIGFAALSCVLTILTAIVPIFLARAVPAGVVATEYECWSPVRLESFAAKLSSQRTEEALDWTVLKTMGASQNGRLTVVQLSTGQMAPIGRLALRFNGELWHIRMQPLTVESKMLKSVYPRLADRLNLPPLQRNLWNLNKTHQVFVDAMSAARGPSRGLGAMDLINHWFQFDQMVPGNYDYRSLLVQGVVVFTDDHGAYIFSRNFMRMAICQKVTGADLHDRNALKALFTLLGNPHFVKFMGCEFLLEGAAN